MDKGKFFAECEKELEEISDWPWKVRLSRYLTDIFDDELNLDLLHVMRADRKFMRLAPERIRILLDSWAEAEARAMKVGFWTKHLCQPYSYCKDERHHYSDTQWFEAAKEKLRNQK